MPDSGAAPHPTSVALLDAGFRLAEERGLTQMTIDAIVAAAGVAKGTFYVHFADRDSFLLALHRHFHARLRTSIVQATEHLPHGSERLRVGTTTYLDACLESRGVKAILQEARTLPAVLAEVRDADARFSRDARACFAAMLAPDADAAARLFVAMSAEAAIAELEAAKRLPALRRTLWALAGIAE